MADLPSVGELLAEEGFGEKTSTAPTDVTPVPLAPGDLAPSKPSTGPAAPTPRPVAPLPPKPLPAAPRLIARVNTPTPLVPRPTPLKPLPTPKPAMPLPPLGLAPSASAPALKVQLPAELGAEALEVVVLVRQNGRVVGEGHVERDVPSGGTGLRLTVELKRG